MRFNPRTEQEIQERSLLPDGVYSYQVIQAEEKISSAGNEYIRLTLKVWNEEGKHTLLFTNLSLEKLLKHICDVNNMQEEYRSGDIPAEMFLKKSGGKVLIGREGEKPDGNGGFFRAKNIVKDYIPDPKVSSTAPLGIHPKMPAADNFVSDDVPF